MMLSYYLFLQSLAKTASKEAGRRKFNTQHINQAKTVGPCFGNETIILHICLICDYLYTLYIFIFR